MIIGLQRSQKMEHETSAGSGLQNVGAKGGHEHRRRTNTLDKVQDMVLEEEEKEGEDIGISSGF